MVSAVIVCDWDRVKETRTEKKKNPKKVFAFITNKRPVKKGTKTEQWNIWYKGSRSLYAEKIRLSVGQFFLVYGFYFFQAAMMDSLVLRHQALLF